jgi:hypothetical protein
VSGWLGKELERMSAESLLVSWRKARIEFFDDGPEKPVRIWSRIGRRPLVAGVNSDGDVPMLRFAHTAQRPGLRLLVLHDDAEREFDYTSGAEDALARAKDRSWTVVSIANDWSTVFADVAEPTNDRTSA